MSSTDSFQRRLVGLLHEDRIALDVGALAPLPRAAEPGEAIADIEDEGVTLLLAVIADIDAAFGLLRHDGVHRGAAGGLLTLDAVHKADPSKGYRGSLVLGVDPDAENTGAGSGGGGGTPPSGAPPKMWTWRWGTSWPPRLPTLLSTR